MKTRGRKFVPPNFSKTVDRGKVKRDEAIMQAHRGVCHGGHSNCKRFWKLAEEFSRKTSIFGKIDKCFQGASRKMK